MREQTWRTFSPSCLLVMAVQDFRLRVLAGKMVEVAVDSLRMAAFRLQLDREVLDAEVRRDPAPDRLKEVACQCLVVPVDLHMCRHHDEAWFDRPNVQIMDVLHAGNGLDGGRNLCGAHTGWSRFQ